ncbi:MAG: TraR/DksA C4-type zinc finger protein [Chloroflexi bacterium]|nr:TraR/DksA C4-type zinc finger protein [Chloroflexota bacterium]
MGQDDEITAEIRAKLEKQLARLQSELRVVEKSLDLKNRADMARPSFGKRVGDYTSEVIERVSKDGSARNLRKLIAETELALDKLGDGTYGICNDCGRPINPERLEALPAAVLCIDCKRKAEHLQNKN